RRAARIEADKTRPDWLIARAARRAGGPGAVGEERGLGDRAWMSRPAGLIARVVGWVALRGALPERDALGVMVAITVHLGAAHRFTARAGVAPRSRRSPRAAPRAPSAPA